MINLTRITCIMPMRVLSIEVIQFTGIPPSGQTLGYFNQIISGNND